MLFKTIPLLSQVTLLIENIERYWNVDETNVVYYTVPAATPHLKLTEDIHLETLRKEKTLWKTGEMLERRTR